MTHTDCPLVLIVEDDPMIARLLRDIFRMQGYQSLVACSAAVAVGHMATARPALITLDLNLPGMSGQSLLQVIRSCAETRSIPVIVVSAQLPIEPRVGAQADAVLEKPFELAELLAAVRRVLTAPAMLAERVVTA